MITATCVLVASIIGKSLRSTAAPSAATQSQQSAVISSAASYGHRINSTNGGSVGQDIEFDNWSGAVLQTIGITEVSGTFEVPNVHPLAKADSSEEYCGAAWVRIDGDDRVCPEAALMQAGVQWCVSQEKGATFSGWGEWVPEEQRRVVFENFQITAGHRIRVTVKTTDSTNGSALIENLSTAKYSELQTLGRPTFFKMTR